MGTYFSNGTVYLNFPVALLQTIFRDKENCLAQIINFSVYKKALRDYGQVDESIMKHTADGLGIILGNAKNGIKTSKALMNQIDQNGPTTGIRKDIIFDYYTNYKTEFQLAVFCAFCAIRSIIGKKSFCKTNKALIHARMFGYRSAKNLPPNFNDLEKKYLKRYHIDKAIKELELNWHLKLFASHCRGFYVSFAVDHDILAKECIKRKKCIKNEKLKKLKKDAFEKAMAEINSPAYSTATMRPMYSKTTTDITAS